jgi:formylglycine-generating enzyme
MKRSRREVFLVLAAGLGHALAWTLLAIWAGSLRVGKEDHLASVALAAAGLASGGAGGALLPQALSSTRGAYAARCSVLVLSWTILGLMCCTVLADAVSTPRAPPAFAAAGLTVVQAQGAQRKLSSSADAATTSVLLMSTSEVTAGDYVRCIRAGACPTPNPAASSPTLSPAALAACTYGRRDRTSHPINCVSQADAKAYCDFVGLELPEAGHYRAALANWSASPSRLPTANLCTGDCSTTDTNGCVPWQCDAADGHRATSPVGSYPEGDSADGITDLHGNVAEWTSTSTQDGMGLLMGSAWSDRLESLEPLERTLPKDSRRPDVGFRCMTRGELGPVSVQPRKVGGQ